MEPIPKIAGRRGPPEPRCPAPIAAIAHRGLSTARHLALIVGPRWLFPGVLAALLVPTVMSHRAGRHDLNRLFGLAVTSVITLGLVGSVILLIGALPSHQQSPTALLLSATSLWFTNILVFALWYWRLDAGGPHGRDARWRHTQGAFLFPQMT